MRSLGASALLVLTFSLCAVGCSHVQPYQREYLTRPGLDVHDEPLMAEFEAHAQNAREGASGGHLLSDSSGGGCGCN